MGKSIRFQLYSALPNLVMMAAMIVIILALNALSGGSGFFASYYTGLPMMFLILSVVFGSNLSMANLHVALCMGACRRSYFWATQVTALVYAVVLTLFQVFAQRIPALLGMTWKVVPFLWQIPWWLFAGYCFTLTLAGVGTGFAIKKSKRTGAIVLIAVFMGAVALFLALMFLDAADAKWGSLRIILLAGIVVGAAAMEFVAWNGYKRAVVG